MRRRTKVLRLPDFAMAREAADEIVNDVHVKSGDAIIVNGRDLAMNSDSFADQLALRLKDARPSSLIIAGGGEAWIEDISRALSEREVHFEAKPLREALKAV
mgnify:CR=1 FL=1